MNTTGLRRWIELREDIRLRRDQGLPPPWTDDPILRNYRFCNVSRWLDATTVRLLRATELAIQDVGPEWGLALCIALRCSSFLPLAQLCCDDLPHDVASFEALALRILVEQGRTTTPSFTRVGPQSRMLVEPMEVSMRKGLLKAIQGANSVQQAAGFLRLLPWVGPFLSYLIAVDLTATSIMPSPSDPLWTEPGPGARKGLARCEVPQDESGVRQIHLEFQKSPPVDSWTFDVHDIEHSLCEFHKWARAMEGGRPPREKRKD